jgi:hypothetical protein
MAFAGLAVRAGPGHSPRLRSFLRGEQFMVLRYPEKLIYGTEGNRELYDLAADPGETRNLAQSDPERTEALHQIGTTWEADTPDTPPRYDAIDKERAKGLRGLGYVQ